MPIFRKIWFGEKSGESFKLLIDINCHTKSEFFFFVCQKSFRTWASITKYPVEFVCVCFEFTKVIL